MTRPAAVFLDRDGTLVDDTGFLRDPAAVRLLPGAADAVARLNGAGIPVTVVTNQSGIARGLITWDEYRAVKARVDELLARQGARLDATYLCPHHPSVGDPCSCRKPGLRLYHEAAQSLRIDLARAAWIGDRLSDVEPAAAFGVKGILLLTGEGPQHADAARVLGVEIRADLAAAVSSLLGAPLADRV